MVAEPFSTQKKIETFLFTLCDFYQHSCNPFFLASNTIQNTLKPNFVEEKTKNGNICRTFFSDCGDSLQKERRCRAHVPGINNEIKLKQTSVSFKRNYESACCQPVFILTGRKQNLGRLPVQAQTVTMRTRVLLQAGPGLASTCKVKNCRIITMIIIIFFFLQDGKKNHFTMELSFSSSSISGQCTDSKVDKCSHCWQTLKAGKLKPGRGRV